MSTVTDAVLPMASRNLVRKHFLSLFVDVIKPSNLTGLKTSLLKFIACDKMLTKTCSQSLYSLRIVKISFTCAFW